MASKAAERGAVKVRFSIGAKLLLIISLITLGSLGALTVLASVLMGEDVRRSAEESNITVNSRSAAQAALILDYTRSAANTLLNSPQSGAALELSRFFGEYPSIAAVAADTASATASADADAGAGEKLLLNRRFFEEAGVDPALAASFLASRRSRTENARRGAASIVSGAAEFGFPLLALFYPRPPASWGAVLFSSEELADSFGAGINSTWMINGEGDILVHPDAELAAVGANAANHPFVRFLWENPAAGLQSVYTEEDGSRWFGAYTKLPLTNAAVLTVVEYDRVFEGVAATTRRNIYLTVAVLCISAVLIMLFSRSISRRLAGLTQGAHLIEGGHFNLNLSPSSADEIGVLEGSFTKMSKALAVFGRFTNREVAAAAMRGEIKPGGFPKHATIFFSDIRGFTEKSENFTSAFGSEAAGKLVIWLNNYFTRMVECVAKTGGVVDKFIGDAVMAHWGTAYSAGSPEKDALNGITAALMMRHALAGLNKSAGGPENPPIRIGCGLNTGMVIAGQIGSDERMEYTAIGDAVNTASRVEALNKPFGTDILITADTYALAGKYLITEEMPPVKVKGKKEALRIFAVINFAPNSKGPRPGPQTIGQLRSLLGIPEPDFSRVDPDAEEKKYELNP